MWRTPWQKLINRSEKIVGYPSSLINIRYLISDEIACVASHIRKLVGTGHPLLKLTKSLIGGTHGMSKLSGLLVLLISKTFNDQNININSNQQSIAEIVETVHAAICVHKDLVNVDSDSTQNKPDTWKYDMQFGNKMSTLCGDYLLGSVCKALAEFQNANIVDMVSRGIGDTIESFFFKLNFENEDHYRKYVYLSNGSLLSKCCRAAVTLGSNKNLVNSEEIAESWAIQWCQLYKTCENIYMITQQMSMEKSTSKIFNSKTHFSQTGNILPHLMLLRNHLLSTKLLLADINAQFPKNNEQCNEVISEMTEFLYQDAIVNLNLCKVF